MAEDIEQIYREYAKNVYRFLYSLCGDAEVSEELTQETFFQAMQSIKRYDGTCKMSVWLCQIAKHLWYRELDRRRRRPTEELTDDVLREGKGNAVGNKPVEDAAILSGDKTALYHAIHALPEPMREIVHLRLSGEFSFSEIGEVLGKSENWARVTFYRAKQRLAEVLLK